MREASQSCDGAKEGQVSYGFFSRKNWEAVETGLVTVKSPPRIAKLGSF